MADNIPEQKDETEAPDSKNKKDAPASPKKTTAPRNPNVPKAKTDAAGTEVVKKSSKKLLIIIILTLAVAGFVTGVIVLNLFGIRSVMRDTFISAVVWLDPEFSAIDDTLTRRSDERSAALDERELALNELDSELELLKEQLDTMEARLDRREANLVRREEQQQQQLQIDESDIPFFKRHMSEEELAEKMSISITYTQMAPADAARILVELTDDNYVATVLYFMSERNRAPILTEMETEYAALITEILLTS